MSKNKRVEKFAPSSRPAHICFPFPDALPVAVHVFSDFLFWYCQHSVEMIIYLLRSIGAAFFCYICTQGRPDSRISWCSSIKVIYFQHFCSFFYISPYKLAHSDGTLRRDRKSGSNSYKIVIDGLAWCRRRRNAYICVRIFVSGDAVMRQRGGVTRPSLSPRIGVFGGVILIVFDVIFRACIGFWMFQQR